MPEDQVRITIPGTATSPAGHHPAVAPRDARLDLAVRIAKSIADPQKRSGALLGIAVEVRENDPEYASRLVEPILDDAAGEAWLSAVRVFVRCAVPPERVALLVREAEEHPDCDAECLAWLAAVRRADDPRDSARLANLAERAAVSVTERAGRDRALRHVAIHVATFDPNHASRILDKISATHWTSDDLSPTVFDEAAATGRGYTLELFDRYFRAVRDRQLDLDERRMELAISIVSTDLYRADAIASRISRTHDRVTALCEMAKKIATTNGEQAKFWLGEARYEATTAGGVAKNQLLGEVAAAAVDVDTALGNEITRLITDEITDDLSADELYWFAGCLRATDPPLAEQLVVRALAMDHDHRYAQHHFLHIAEAQAKDSAKALATLDRVQPGPDDVEVRVDVATILIKIAAGLAIWNPAEATAVLHRAQRELSTVGPASLAVAAWASLAAELVQLDPELLEKLAARLSGQDAALAAIAVGVVRASGSRTA
ncbi:hypothetical protein [Lentzea sp. NPDC059081]|uniref:hypothetical protein n=1 Tax=Lentzea sp. NPDC059081 TaxID=3346719 RepID=UPI003674F318